MNESTTVVNEGSGELVIIIGAGVSGIGSSYYLSKANIPHLILEKSTEIGGIWNSMKWPGIRCDSYIMKYSYSFKPLLIQQSMASGEVIGHYLNEVVDEFDIRNKVRFGVEVRKIIFNSGESKWHVHTNQGIFTARFIVNANGYFESTPYLPSFNGSGTFKGEIRHLFDLSREKKVVYEGKKILLVGSGASAISAVTQLHEDSSSLTLLQRSPSYIFDEDNSIGFLIRMAQNLYKRGLKWPLFVLRWKIQVQEDFIFVLFRKVPWIGKWFFRNHWKKAAGKEAYEAHFKPSYKPWEQRIPVAIGFKELVRNKKIDIVTSNIDTFNETGLRTTSGEQLDFDLCVLATGFDLNFFKFEVWVDDKRINTDGINFYKGMMMGGIPNYFQPVGTSHTTWTQRSEMVSNLIAKVIQYMEKQNYTSVSIPRKILNQPPVNLTPNYVKRVLPKLPVMYGAYELPSIDRFLFYSFRKKNFNFSA